MSGSKIIKSQCVSDGISYCVGSEVSPPHPECWRCGVFEETFSEADEADAGM